MAEIQTVLRQQLAVPEQRPGAAREQAPGIVRKIVSWSPDPEQGKHHDYDGAQENQTQQAEGQSHAARGDAERSVSWNFSERWHELHWNRNFDSVKLSCYLESYKLC